MPHRKRKAVSEPAPLEVEQPACEEQRPPHLQEENLPYLAGKPEGFANLADVLLVVEGVELPVHSQILAAQSVFFAGLFGDVEAPTKLARRIGARTRSQSPALPAEHEMLRIDKGLEGKRVQDVKSLLMHVYGAECRDLQLADAEVLLPLADEFGLDELLWKWDRNLSHRSRYTKDPLLPCNDIASVISWALLAARFNLQRTLVQCERFLMQHFNSAVGDVRLAELPQTSLLVLARGLAYDNPTGNGARKQFPSTFEVEQWHRSYVASWEEPCQGNDLGDLGPEISNLARHALAQLAGLGVVPPASESGDSSGSSESEESESEEDESSEHESSEEE